MHTLAQGIIRRAAKGRRLKVWWCGIKKEWSCYGRTGIAAASLGMPYAKPVCVTSAGDSVKCRRLLVNVRRPVSETCGDSHL